MEIKCSIIFEKNFEAIASDKRYIVNEGGSRSTKTFSLCQLLILKALTEKNLIINIFRKSLATTKRTVLKDFKEVLNTLNIWDQFKEKITECSYTFNSGSIITFYGADESEKLRGLKSDIAWLNEATEFHYDDFQQIAMRTTGKIILDYNPSANSSYLYSLPDEKTIKIHSTYKDNPFLSKEQIETIEGYKLTDLSYYTIFALGLRANSKENVYQEWTILKEKPEYLNDYLYGIDFGFTHPTALVKIWYNADPKINQLYIEELIYESNMTSTDIVNRLNELKVDKKKTIVADYARPEIMKEMRKAGYTVMDAIKDVKDGINNVKTFEILVNDFATNVIKENNLYKYKKVNGEIIDDVIKLNDDAMDAIRYAIFYIKKYYKKQPNTKQVYTFNM
jgi:phage terminase large subunit